MIEIAPFKPREELAYLLTRILFIIISMCITIYLSAKLNLRPDSMRKPVLFFFCYFILIVLFSNSLDSWLFCVLGYFF
ncbi:hypothetical protein SAMN02745664_103155 [Moraxella cuniculi DSM 21768]|uniref:Uncharacterized protein n=2 Tax=Moraxella cuniculi TaxID=34061 RepID=A0A1N7E7M9_9GAMM|nr:hypothetical protein B0189_04440 [Moraxella cuniculi]SIR84070.1 hypothetical protein SAMN02745664_103155 [Moraxella cuniculi DSM 21768]